MIIGVKVDQEGTGYLDVATYGYSGLDVDMSRELATRIFQVNDPFFLPVSSDTRESTLEQGAVAFFAATYTMNHERSLRFKLAGPYLVTRQGVMVRKDQKSISSLRDLAGKNVCVVGGGSLSEKLFEKNVSGAHATALTSYSECLRKLKDRKYDAFSTDQAILYGYAPKNSELTVVPDLVIGPEIMYGIAFRKDDQARCEKARDELVKIVGAGGPWASMFRDNLPDYASAHPDYLTQVKPTASQIKVNSCIELN
ncbi:transporter substrate-binding domain-containing protein [Micromonospora sp. WMMD708]|uniref:transporter substrate-binding domain-containing protein n=1 Tax=Micromonospora sp. WMMD708 TaxID=3403464 RepID=UPI003BF5B6A2